MYLFGGIIFTLTLIFAQAASGQIDRNRTTGEPSDPEAPEVRGVRDMLAKQRVAKEKRDHEELLRKGDAAVKLSGDIESSFNKDSHLSPASLAKLADLEKLVLKIRKDLGGRGDDQENAEDVEEEGSEPSTLAGALKTLHEKTALLVEELKRSTRFTVSGLAIRTSNAVIRTTRVLRLFK